MCIHSSKYMDLRMTDQEQVEISGYMNPSKSLTNKKIGA